jgi:hypothetical protein
VSPHGALSHLSPVKDDEREDCREQAYVGGSGPTRGLHAHDAADPDVAWAGSAGLLVTGMTRALGSALGAVGFVLLLGLVALLPSAADSLAFQCSAPGAGAHRHELSVPPAVNLDSDAHAGGNLPCSVDSGLTDGAAMPVPYAGGRTGCVEPDPTGTGGCVTGSTRHLLDQVRAGWGAWPGSCWDAHAWNPRSDHPRGLACDFTVGRLGRRPSAEARARGWGLAEWLLAGADRLAVRYVIFDGLYCPAGGACRPYGGGGVYDPESVTGGHFDHVHVSLRDGSGTA